MIVEMRTPEAVAEVPLALRPRHDHVIVEPVEFAEQTKTGLHLPQTSRKRSNEGVIRAIGPGSLVQNPASGAWERKPIDDLFVGQRVLFLRWTGFATTIEGAQYVTVEERDILCLATDDAVKVGLDEVSR